MKLESGDHFMDNKWSGKSSYQLEIYLVSAVAVDNPIDT